MTQPARPAHSRIDDIEILRGIAVLMVLAFHFRPILVPWELPWWDNLEAHYLSFWPGVDLFFAISGFVIGRTLLPQLARGRQSGQVMHAALAFWLRRAWRLLPSAWLWLFLLLVQSAVFNRSFAMDSFHTNFQATIAGFLSVANFRMANCWFRFPYGGSGHYWSLSLEEQFYAVLPPVVLLSRRYLVPVLFAALLIFMCLPQGLWLMSFRAHALILGILLAIAHKSPDFAAVEPKVLRNSPFARIACLLLPLLMMSALAPVNQHISTRAIDVISLLSVIPVFIGSFNQNYLPPAGLARRFLLWTGSRSYGIYLIHLPAYFATREIWFRAAHGNIQGGSGWALIYLFTALPLNFLLAELNYRWLETPLRRRGAAIAATIWPSPSPGAAA